MFLGRTSDGLPGLPLGKLGRPGTGTGHVTEGMELESILNEVWSFPFSEAGIVLVLD